MKDGPDIARIASLIGDPGRANMLSALMSGKALTARELAEEAGISAPTASGHLAKLEDGRLITQSKQGRHRYFTLASHDVAEVLEALMGLAMRSGHIRLRTGPRDPAMREARVCYDHLAGEAGVALLDALRRQGFVTGEEEIQPTGAGRAFLADLDIDVTALEGHRRALCRPCLDWSQRRMHLGGALGASLLGQILERGWAERVADSRVVRFTPSGERAFRTCFGIEA